MTVRIYLKSGAEIAVRCKDLQALTGSDGTLRGLRLIGPLSHEVLFISYPEIAAIVREGEPAGGPHWGLRGHGEACEKVL